MHFFGPSFTDWLTDDFSWDTKEQRTAISGTKGIQISKIPRSGTTLPDVWSEKLIIDLYYYLGFAEVAYAKVEANAQNWN